MADDIPLAERQFSVVVVHSGVKILGESIPGSHAFFCGLSVGHAGPSYAELQLNEGGCVRRAATADGRMEERGKSVPILYSVTRVR